jgi:aminotransferase in exopolysaccharide biosynthesis
MFDEIFSFIRGTFTNPEGVISLHEPRFDGNERKYVNEAIDSTFVSSVGEFVNEAEAKLAEILGVKWAILCMNGTAALQVALKVAGVERDTEVLTQALTFVATANAVRYLGAHPVFLDVDAETMGMSPEALIKFLTEETELRGGVIHNRRTGRAISACLPMHTFGHPCKIGEIVEICSQWGLAVVEDAAESLGSEYAGKATGRFGKCAALSFNGNKIVTSGGGGAVVTEDVELARAIKNLTTTAKVPHAWDFVHTEVGYNFRMPNINAALLLGQLEKLDEFLEQKRNLAERYAAFFETQKGVRFIKEPAKSKSNYWLCAVQFDEPSQQQEFLRAAHDRKILVRPPWKLMTDLDMYRNCQRDELLASRKIQRTVVNLPSSARGFH